jgi:formate/nitrite transporter FocA (FNT family)
MADHEDPAAQAEDFEQDSEERKTVSEAVRDEQQDGEGSEFGEVEDEPHPLGLEAPEIIHDAALIGRRRLHRPLSESLITGLIGGMSVSFGAISLAWASASVGGSGAEANVAHLAGALAFPVGFIILLIGKSELFTEDFFLPVTAVLEREGTLAELGKLWGVTLFANLLGVLTFALLISRPDVLDTGPAEALIDLARKKTDFSYSTAFIKAIFAGWLMTLLTWLLLASEGFGSKLVIIWMIGSLIVLGEFNHVVISAAEIWIAILLDAPIGATDWLTRNFLPALAGNVFGGVVFVTLLHYAQAITQIRGNRFE